MRAYVRVRVAVFVCLESLQGLSAFGDYQLQKTSCHVCFL